MHTQTAVCKVLDGIDMTWLQSGSGCSEFSNSRPTGLPASILRFHAPGPHSAANWGISKSICLQGTSDRPLSESRRIKIWRAGKVDRLVVLQCYTPQAQIKDFNWAPCPSRFLSSKPLISDGLNAASAGPVASILSPQASMTHVGFFFSFF